MNDHWAVHSAVPVEDKMNHYPIAWAVMLLNGRRVEQRDGKEPSGSFFRSRTSRSENERKRRFALTLKRSADSLAAWWDASCT
jgi:hypothetical protein